MSARSEVAELEKDDLATVHKLSLPEQSPNRNQAAYGLAFAAVVLIALLLRAWNFFRLGLDHYDEGVYALSGYWSLHFNAGSVLYPFQKLFSPPGYLGLIGLAYRLAGGASDHAAIAINIFFGVATVALAGWMGQRWFGRSCGIAAAVLVAASDFDIALARTALTDTLFTFLFLLALALIAISLEKESVAWAFMAGAVGGVSWNVKYDGWLPAGIAFVAIMALIATGKESFAGVKRKLLLWGIVAGATLVLYLPWVIYTQERLGGYLAVEAFHRTFLNFNWPENFFRQAGSQIYFDSFLSHISFVAAFLLVLVTRERRGSTQWRPICLVLGGLIVSAFVLGGTGTCMVLAVTGLYAAWRRSGTLGPILVSGISIFFVLIPCYTGFARLTLPLMLLLQIAAGVGIPHILEEAESSSLFTSGAQTPADRGIIWALSAMGLLAVMAIGVRASILKKTDPWNSPEKDGLRNVVAKMTAMIPAGSVVFVQEEPDAAFYLQRAGYTTHCFMHLAGDGTVPGPFKYFTISPVYLVAGPYTQISPEWNPLPEEDRKRLAPLARFQYQPGDVRLLDDFNPEGASQYRMNPDGRYNLLLLRVLPRQAGAGPPTLP
jgi:hypothetical protein